MGLADNDLFFFYFDTKIVCFLTSEAALSEHEFLPQLLDNINNYWYF